MNKTQETVNAIVSQANSDFLLLGSNDRMHMEYRVMHKGIEAIICLNIRPAHLFDLAFSVTWTVYIVLWPDNFNEGYFDNNLWLEGRRTKHGTVYDYSAILSELPWHGGITFYAPYFTLDSPDRSIKIGCDFSHLGDPDGTPADHYSYGFVAGSIKTVIDELHEHYQIKVRCALNGKWYKSDEGIFIEGRFYSTEGQENNHGA